jgi:nucleotide-binding universal stress UspA family protein
VYVTTMYDDVLVPVDRNSVASAVLYHVGEIAHWADATVRLIHVADTGRDSVSVTGGDVVDALEREGEGIVEEAGKTLDTLGVDYVTDVVQGTPAETIVDYADRFDYDLVVMPTHGREGLSRYLLGSVTEKVVRLSRVPVLTARMRDDEDLTFPFEGVLLPTDGSPSAGRAVAHGLDLAAAMDATVHAVSVVEDDVLGPDVRSTVSAAETEGVAREALDDVVAAAEERGIDDVETHVERGAADESILDAVEAYGVDGIVMGTTGRSGVDRILLGSVAEKTVRSAPVPVITVGDE